MNNLSWFLYFADVLPNFGHVLMAISIIFTIALILFVVAYAIHCDDTDSEFNFKILYLILVPIVFSLFSTMIPSKETFYLIAGSEAGEQVITSEQGQEVLSDIQEVIQYQLQKLKGEGK